MLRRWCLKALFGGWIPSFVDWKRWFNSEDFMDFDNNYKHKNLGQSANCVMLRDV